MQEKLDLEAAITAAMSEFGNEAEFEGELELGKVPVVSQPRPFPLSARCPEQNAVHFELMH